MSRRRAGRRVCVLVVDDHPLVANAIWRLLAAEPDLDPLPVAHSVHEARERLAEPIDVALLDYQLPDGTGVQVARLVRQRWPRARVVMLSALNDDETMIEAIHAGAEAYLSKSDAIEDTVVDTVRRVYAGETLIAPGLLAEISRRVERLRGESHRSIEALTPREREVLEGLARGRDSATLSADLGIGEATLHTHLAHLMQKLGAHSRLEAVTIGLTNRLIEPPTRPASRAV